MRLWNIDENYDISLASEKLKNVLTIANEEGEIICRTVHDVTQILNMICQWLGVPGYPYRSFWSYDGGRFRDTNYNHWYSNSKGGVSINELDGLKLGWLLEVEKHTNGGYQTVGCQIFCIRNEEGYTLESFQSAMEQVNREGLEKPNYLASDKGLVKVS